MDGLLLWVLLFPSTIFAVSVQESPVTCQSNDIECNPFGDDSIGNFGGIETLQVWVEQTDAKIIEVNLIGD